MDNGEITRVEARFRSGDYWELTVEVRVGDVTVTWNDVADGGLGWATAADDAVAAARARLPTLVAQRAARDAEHQAHISRSRSE